MRLELADFLVATISIGERFHYHSGELTVDRGAIEQAVLEEKRIEAAWLEVVAPGDKVRITGIRDVVERHDSRRGGYWGRGNWTCAAY